MRNFLISCMVVFLILYVIIKSDAIKTKRYELTSRDGLDRNTMITDYEWRWDNLERYFIKLYKRTMQFLNQSKR
jgi:hypothetical protein